MALVAGRVATRSCETVFLQQGKGVSKSKGRYCTYPSNAQYLSAGDTNCLTCVLFSDHKENSYQQCSVQHSFGGNNTVHGCRSTAAATGAKPADHNRADHY